MEGEWMNMPQVNFDCPPGLEYLTTIDHLLVHQKVKLTFTPARNNFIIKNNKGENIYYALEDSDSFSRNCYGSERAFDMAILDNYRNEVIHVYRPRTTGCCYRGLAKIEVSAPPGTTVGTVEEQWTWLCPIFFIKNVSGDTILRIERPSGGCCGDIDFRVLSGNGSVEVGRISKQWTGRLIAIDDYFEITFPMDLDVRMKALMIGALFLIDIRYFDR